MHIVAQTKTNIFLAGLIMASLGAAISSLFAFFLCAAGVIVWEAHTHLNHIALPGSRLVTDVLAGISGSLPILIIMGSR